jgi:hypothetical protein
MRKRALKTQTISIVSNYDIINCIFNTKKVFKFVQLYIGGAKAMF